MTITGFVMLLKKSFANKTKKAESPTVYEGRGAMQTSGQGLI